MFGNTVQLGIKITSDVAQGVSGLSKTESMLGKVKVGAAVAAAAIGAAVIAAGKFAIDAIGAAGNLEQSIGAVDTVFKDSAGQMHDWAKGAAQNVGLARNEYNELGTLIGTQLKNGGTAMDQLAPKTNDLIQTGADLASMFGGTTKDAVSALSSALKGERDPIERYGVSLNQARVDAKAAELGFKKVGGTLSAEANQAATLALIMEQTADAHGNFAKEADTLQGKQQRFAAEMENTKTIIGTALLPIASQLFGFFNDKLAPVLGDLAERFATFVGSLDVAGWWQRVTDGVSGAAGSFDGVLAVVGRVVDWFNADLRPALDGLVDAFKNRFDAIVAIGSELVAGLWTKLEPLMPQIEAVFVTIGDIVSGAVELIAALWDATTQGMLMAWELVGPPLIDLIGTTWETILGIIGPALDLISSIIDTALAALRGDWSAAWDGVKAIGANAWRLIVGIVTGAINQVKASITVVMSVVGQVWSGAWSAIKDVASSAWSAISGAVRSGVDGVVSWFSGLPGRVVSALSGMSTQLAGVGRNMMSGLIGGIKAMAGRVVDSVRGVINDAIGGAKKLLGIASPSKLFRQLGIWTGRGMADGITSQTGVVARAGDRMVSAAIPSRLPSLPAARTAAAGGAGAGAGHVLHVHFDNVVTDPQAAARAIQRMLDDLARSDGRLTLNGAYR